ncbi:MAG TPA: hypothetical protein VI385_05340 [Flavisolibacter sp.]
MRKIVFIGISINDPGQLTEEKNADTKKFSGIFKRGDTVVLKGNKQLKAASKVMVKITR